MTTPEQPARRLADRLLDEGALLAQTYVDRERDRLDPTRPTLGSLVAEALALAERRGEQRASADAGLRVRLEALIEQRTSLRDERIAVARKHIEGNLPLAASELRWAADLDEQIGALRLLLIEPAGEGS